jgi:peptidoglycan hydrolase CwlO-like protein
MAVENDATRKELNQEKQTNQALRLKVAELEVKLSQKNASTSSTQSEIDKLKNLNNQMSIEIGALKFDMAKQLQDFKRQLEAFKKQVDL